MPKLIYERTNDRTNQRTNGSKPVAKHVTSNFLNINDVYEKQKKSVKMTLFHWSSSIAFEIHAFIEKLNNTTYTVFKLTPLTVVYCVKCKP